MAARRPREQVPPEEPSVSPDLLFGGRRRSRLSLPRLLAVAALVLAVAGLGLFSAGYGTLAVAVPLAGAAVVLGAAVVYDVRRFLAGGGRTRRRGGDLD